LVDGSGTAFGGGDFITLEEPNHFNQVSSALWRDRGSASKEGACCGLRVNGVVLAQAAAAKARALRWEVIISEALATPISNSIVKE
jgi:hypothetical protein